MMSQKAVTDELDKVEQLIGDINTVLDYVNGLII